MALMVMTAIEVQGSVSAICCRTIGSAAQLRSKTLAVKSRYLVRASRSGLGRSSYVNQVLTVEQARMVAAF